MIQAPRDNQVPLNAPIQESLLVLSFMEVLFWGVAYFVGVPDWEQLMEAFRRSIMTSRYSNQVSVNKATMKLVSKTLHQ